MDRKLGQILVDSCKHGVQDCVLALRVQVLAEIGIFIVFNKLSFFEDKVLVVLARTICSVVH